MARKSNMRWRDQDVQQLKKAVRNYNAKLRRQRKKLLNNEKRFEASQLPEKVSYKEFRNTIQTRKDYNAAIRKMEGYIKTNAKFELDKRTEKRLDDTIEQFNRKVDNLRRKIRRQNKGLDKITKRQGELAALPAILNKKEILKNIQSEEALKEFIKEHKKFLKDGAEEFVELPDTKHNIKMTKWQKNYMERSIKKINAEREKERKRWDEAAVKYGGKEAGYKRREVGMNKGDHDIKDMKMYNYSSTYTDLKKKLMLMIREQQPGYWDIRTELARFNYIEALELRGAKDHEIGKQILARVKNIDLNAFRRVLTAEVNIWLTAYKLDSQDETKVYKEIWEEWFPDEYDVDEEYSYYQQHKEWRKVGE